MPMTSQQIVTRALQIAKAPGFTVQAGLSLNDILRDLCQNYDLEVARKTVNFNFTGINGPYPLPADFLRVRKGMIFYVYNTVPYFPIPVDISEYDTFTQQLGLASFPKYFTTDMATAPPNGYFWPPPSIAVPVTLRYYTQMADIGSGAYGALDVNPPESSAVIPWFPVQSYLITELAGRMCKDTDDERANSLVSDDPGTNPQGSGVILRRYLKLKDDPEGKTNRVELDRRLFGTGFNRLPNTKNIGW